MEELGKFVGVFGELGLDLWILDRHFRPNQHGSEPKVPDLGDSSGLCFLHLGPNLHLGRRLRSDTDVSFVSIQQRHHLHDNMVDRCMYLPVLLDPELRPRVNLHLLLVHGRHLAVAAGWNL